MERGFVDKAHLTDRLQFSVAAFAGLTLGGTADQFWAAAGATAVQVALIGTSKTHPVVDWTDIQLLA